MGARQSKRSVDITTTPKKEGGANSGESAVIGDAAAPGDGKLERIEESDTKPTTNGIALHTDITEDKDKDKDEATEKEKDIQQSEEAKSDDTKLQESSGESPVEGATEVTTPTEANPTSPNVATAASSPDSKEPKKKDKMRKKWSLRSISFSKKDKSKPTREEAPKNGDVAKEEPLAEGGEEGENAASSPAEEKSTASSPSENESSAPLSSSVLESKEESVSTDAVATTTAATTTAATTTTDATTAATTTTTMMTTATATTTAATAITSASTTATATVTSTETATETATTTSLPPPPPPSSSPVAEEKKEEPTPTAPIPALLEDKKEEAETIEAEKNVVEVSPAADDRSVVAKPVEVSVFRVEPLETPSIIERKTSEDLLAQLPSSPPLSPPPPPPPPTTLVESTPLEQKHRHAVNATAAPAILTEALDSSTDPPVLDPLKIYPPPSPPPPPPPPPRESFTASPPCAASVAAAAAPLTAAVVDPSPEKNPPLANPESSLSSVVVASEELDTVSESKIRVSLETTRSSETSSRSEAIIEIDQDGCESKTVESSLEQPEETKEEHVKYEESDGNVNVIIKVEEIPSDDAAVADELDHDFEEIVVEPGDDVANEEELTVSDNDEDYSKKEVERVTVPAFVVVDDNVVDDDGTEREEDDEEVLVEAKPAVVIPAEEVKDYIEIVEEIIEDEESIDDSMETTKPAVEVIPPEDPIETKSTLEATAAVPTEETVPLVEVCEVEAESLSGGGTLFENIEQPISETIAVVEKLADGEKDIIEIAEIDNSPIFSSPISESMAEELDDVSAVQLPSPPSSSSPQPPPPPQAQSQSQSSPPNVARIVSMNDQISSSATVLIASSTTVVPDEIPLMASTLRTASDEIPLPPEDLSTVLPRSFSDNENVSLPTKSTTNTTTRVPSASSAADSYQFPPRSNTNSAIDVTTESMSSPSLDSYDHSESELKERLAHSPAETENREEISSRRSFNDDASTAIQENHQSVEKSPENEVLVEKSAPREVGKATEESVEEAAPKVAPAPPTVPVEVPASPPPSVPVITEDVASVTKAIEEIDISDKAVAAAVNEAIECNTNEIIADAHHQNNMNE